MKGCADAEMREGAFCNGFAGSVPAKFVPAKFWFWLWVGLADGVAEVPLVDAVELVCGGEMHCLYDVGDGSPISKPPLRFRHPRVLDRLV